MAAPTPAEHAFEKTVRLNEATLPLARAALEIAWAFDPVLDVELHLGRLHALAAEARGLAEAETSDRAKLDALIRYLFDHLGFRGNLSQYDDPRNSYLNEVLGRRLGIPITLSVLMIEIGRGTGLRLDGVGFPGHFLVRWIAPDGMPVYLDAFNGGRVMEERQLLNSLQQMGIPESRSGQFLSSVTKRQILTRMLQNLKALFLNRRSFEDAHRSVGLILTLSPWDLDERRDRGMLALALEQYHDADQDLSAYLRFRPSATDAEMVRSELSRIRRSPSNQEGAP